MADKTEESQDIYGALDALRNERNYLQSLLEHERGNARAAEADRVARGQVIEEQGAATALLHAQIHDQLAQLKELYETRERLLHERSLLAGLLESVLGEVDSSGALRRSGAVDRNPLLESLRDYNHQVVDRLARATPIAGRRVLDIGASPHGFALEWALRHRAAEYVGIGLDMPHETQVRAGACSASLRRMNAEELQFPDGHFDAALSISTFEHIANLDRALSECHRVLRPRGQCLLVFEPIWTSSIGHHLHHFGEVASLVPDWAHLLWSREEMGRHLAGRWPSDAPLTTAQALHWIYEGEDLNRKGIREIEAVIARSPLRVEHKESLREELRQPEQLEAALVATGLTRDELLTRGFSLLLVRP